MNGTAKVGIGSMVLCVIVFFAANSYDSANCQNAFYLAFRMPDGCVDAHRMMLLSGVAFVVGLGIMIAGLARGKPN